MTARLSDEAVRPLRTLDPDGPLDDLGWLDAVVGDARVVAIGESAHYNREFFQLRHRILRYLVERHGFGAYAMESGFVEGRLVDGWLRDGGDLDGDLDRVLANGLTSLMGLWTQARAHLEWMRAHDTRWYGIDLGGSNVSLLPGLDAVTAYLATADPEFQPDPVIRETAAAFSAPSVFTSPAVLTDYAALPSERRDALTARLAILAARMAGRRLDYVRCTSAEEYERALHALRLVAALDTLARTMSGGNPLDAMLARESAIADTVEWILRREDRIVLAAHNGHVQRWASTVPGMPPAPSMGMFLADRLGADYVVVGTTSGTGQTLNTGPDFFTGTLFTEQELPEPGSLDAVLAASHDGPFATDLRRLSPADTAVLRAVIRQRHGAYYSDLNVLDAYDAIVHVPHVTAADLDHAAVAASPEDIRKVLA